MKNEHLTGLAFADLALDEAIQQGIRDSGFTYCTPIQAGTLPIALSGRDTAGQAQTGTGKTAAFLVALLQHLIDHPAPPNRHSSQPRAMVLAPTRELAIQIHADAEKLNRHTGFVLGLVYGGVDYEKQRQQLRDGIDILIGTPGRLIDYFKQHVFNLRALQVLVIDEADRMFDLGFIADLRYLMRRMSPPEQRLSMLFSATLSYRVMELAYEHMNNPERVEIAPEQVTADRVEQCIFYPSNQEKIPLLIGLIQHEQPERSIVFVNTKRAAEQVERWLEANDVSVALLSGDVPQQKRQRLLREFGDGRYRVLLATDVAARGLHIPDVSHVFNFDLPQAAEDYVHRIGRTARAGAAGKAISLACEDFAYSLPEIEAYIGLKIPSLQTEPYLATEVKQPTRGAEHHARRPHRASGGRGQDQRTDNTRRPRPPRRQSQG
ncbi:MAG: ATP-dependent RNA helicase RhlB [Thiotrichales bacterium]